MRDFGSFQAPLTLAAFGVIIVIATQVGACTEGQVAPTGAATVVTGVSAVMSSASSVTPQNDALDAAAVTSGPGATSGATMPSVVGSGVGSGVSSVGSGAGSAGSGR